MMKAKPGPWTYLVQNESGYSASLENSPARGDRFTMVIKLEGKDCFFLTMPHGVFEIMRQLFQEIEDDHK